MARTLTGEWSGEVHEGASEGSGASLPAARADDASAAETRDPPARRRAAPAGTAAFAKFMHLLRLVADSRHPCSIADLTRMSGYPRSTVHRMVAAMVAERLFAESLSGKSYVLGPRLIELASRSWGRSEIRLAAMEDLKRLRDTTGETVHLAVPDGPRMVYIEKLENLGAVRMASQIGTSVDLHSSSVGKSYLAALDESESKALLRKLALTAHTPHSLRSLAQVRRALDQARQQGWAEDIEENEDGICCYGAPVFNSEGMPVAAISVSMLRFHRKADFMRAYVEPLLATCRAVSRRISQMPEWRY